jgi:two-component sensor histidine kinase
MFRFKIAGLPALLLLSFCIHGQDIPRQRADSLLGSLRKSSSDSLRIDALLALAEFNISKPGGRKLNLDSAASFIETAKQLNPGARSWVAEGNIILLEACLAEEKNVSKIPDTLFEKAVNILETTNDRYHLTKGYIELLNYYSNDPKKEAEVRALKEKITSVLQGPGGEKQSNLTPAQKKALLSRISYIDGSWPLELLQDFVVLCHRINDRDDEIWARKEIADNNLRQGKTAVAEAQLLKLLDDYKSTGYPHICNTYDLLAGIYTNQYKYNKALSYAFETLKSMAPEDSLYLIFFYIRICNIYTALDKTEENIQWIKKIMDYYISAGENYNLYPALFAFAANLIRLGRAQEALQFVLTTSKNYPPVTSAGREMMCLSLARCYATLNDWVPAEKYFQEAFKFAQIRRKSGEIVYDDQLDDEIGVFYANTGQYRKAEYFLKKALGERTPDAAYIYRNAYLGLYKVDSARRDYLSAIDNLKTYEKLNDSVFNTSKNRQIEELQVAYNTEQKDQDIKTLQEQEKIEAIRRANAENTRNWIIAAAAMLALLLAVSYNRYRLKRRSNRQLQTQQAELNRLVKDKDGLLLQKDQLLLEKEWLLKEVHHRVKNNLHTVICLLESQAAYLENDALKAIQNSQHRIYAMSLIHQKLYQSEDVKTIDMGIYLPEFIGYLNDSFNTSGQIRFNLHVEPIKLDVSQAIPLALIINEAVTNSIKYAFSMKKTGLITVAMYQSGQQKILEIADDGIGLPPDVVELQSNSLGFRLMKGLSEDINAEFRFRNQHGTTIIIILDSDDFGAEKAQSKSEKAIFV